jgi:CRISPR-associated protein Cas2
MGRCLLVYDISHDGTRTKVADVCLDYGLDRIQYSAFCGALARTHQQELMLKIKRLLGRREGNVQLYALCEKDWAERKVIQQGTKAVPGEGGDRDHGSARSISSTSGHPSSSVRRKNEGHTSAPGTEPTERQPLARADPLRDTSLGVEEIILEER